MDVGAVGNPTTENNSASGRDPRGLFNAYAAGAAFVWACPHCGQGPTDCACPCLECLAPEDCVCNSCPFCRESQCVCDLCIVCSTFKCDNKECRAIMRDWLPIIQHHDCIGEDEDNRCHINEEFMKQDAAQSPDLRLGKSYFLGLMNEAQGSFTGFLQLLESELINLLDKRRYCETSVERMYDAGVSLRRLNLFIMEQVLFNLTTIGERTTETIAVAAKKALILYEDDLAGLWRLQQGNADGESLIDDTTDVSDLGILSGAAEPRGISKVVYEPSAVVDHVEDISLQASSDSRALHRCAFWRDLEKEMGPDAWRKDMVLYFKGRKGKKCIGLHLLDPDEEPTFSRPQRQT